MDTTIQQLERAQRANPDDELLYNQLVGALARCGRLYDARQLVRQRLKTRCFKTQDLQTLVNLGREAGFVSSYPVRRSPLMNFAALFHARRGVATEVEVEIGFAGVRGSGALVSVLALADFFGLSASGLVGSGLADPRPLLQLDKQNSSGQESPGPDILVPFETRRETTFEFRLELTEPWEISRRFRLRGIRVTTIPGDQNTMMLRRKILRSVNALAFVPDTRTDGTGETNEAVFQRLDREFTDVWGLPIDRFRVLIQYMEPTRRELHKALMLALGLKRCPKVHADVETTAERAHRPQRIFSNFRIGRDRLSAHEGVLDTFALLLLRTISDLARV